MKRLCEQLNVNTSIKNISGSNIIDIIKIVFKDSKYKFYLNSELIDVNDRFRIFEYQKKNYIVKKTKKTDGDLEIKLARKAEELLDGLIVDDYTIHIVKPNIYYIDDFAYILTEYMGNSLQECNYSKSTDVSINLNTVFDILELFLKKGVLYRGFLPRNMVIDKNDIYLLDWEDAIFDDKAESGINLLWKTNFILNWSYFFDSNNIEELLNKYCILNNQEPALLKYEKKFKSIANLDYGVADLRKCILKTVMESERKVEESTPNFIIPPNDMAHLVSDLFNSDIDVLFDVSSSILRKKSESKYVELLEMLSRVIINSYSKNESIQKGAIRIILKFMEVAAGNCVNYDLLNTDRIIYFNKIKEILNKLIYNFNKTEIGEENFIRIANYIYSYR